MLGNIIWICPLAPGTSTDVLIWDGYGPSRTRGDFFDFEVGGNDVACKGRIHVIVPFIGRKNGTLTARQQCYNDVHGWYRAHIEQLGCGIGVWLGTSSVVAPMSCTSQSVFCCILHNFASRGKSVTPPTCLVLWLSAVACAGQAVVVRCRMVTAQHPTPRARSKADPQHTHTHLASEPGRPNTTKPPAPDPQHPHTRATHGTIHQRPGEKHRQRPHTPYPTHAHRRPLPKTPDL